MVEQGLDVLRGVWSAQPGKYVCISTKSASGWKDRLFDNIDKALEFARNVASNGKKVDLYWAPMKFTGPKRRAEYVAGVKYLWQDLDYCSPDKIPPELQPSIVWESSPGRFHGLWELTDVVDIKRQQAVNQALAKRLAPLGCDKGGWDATQVLRIPGTRNWKYKDGPIVQMRTALNRPWPLQKVANTLDLADPQGGQEKAPDCLSDDVTPEKILVKYRGQIPRKVMGLLLADEAEEGRRSDILWYIGHELIKAGLHVDEVYVLLKHSVWNKYEGRRDEEERLRHEIARAVEDEVLDPPKTNRKQPRDEGDDDDRDSTFSLILETDDELMKSLETPGWLVEGFWTRRSHGIVAGEPKSFKSTLVTDLVVSVASGKPFLGKFEVHDPGPVLVIQNENAKWIMKDRFGKVRAGRGLVGEYERKDNELWVRWAPELPIYYINQQGVMLTDPLHRKAIEKAIYDVSPVLVVFDPLYLMFDGDLNAAKDLNTVLQWLLSLKNRFNTGILVVHHWKKAQSQSGSSRGGQRMLGSTTLHGWIESAWYLSVGGSDSTDDESGENDREEEIEDAVNRSTATAEITVEREFRGAGMFPRVDVRLTMGGFGEDRYEVEVEKHKPKTSKKEESANEAKVAILHTLDLQQERVSARFVCEEVGISQRKAKALLSELEKDGRVKYVGKGSKGGWILVRSE